MPQKTPKTGSTCLVGSEMCIRDRCGYYKRRFGVEIRPEQVMSCYGSQEGMGHIGMALCNEGDTVLLPTPCYPVFIAGSLLGGAKPWYYPLSKENGFLPNPDDCLLYTSDAADE